MKICVIGNSHVGALKAGYDLLIEPSYKAWFWSIPGGDGPYITIIDNKISSLNVKTEKIKTDIPNVQENQLDISQFDAILLSGIGIPAIRKQNKTCHNKYLAGGFLDRSCRIDRQVLSKEVFSKIIRNELHNLSSFKNISLVESIFKKKILIQMFPLPTEKLYKQEDLDVPCYGKNLASFLSWYYMQQNSIIKEHISLKNINLIGYPVQWAHTGFTPDEYGSSFDAWHMNAKFGEFFMGTLLPENLT